MCVQAAARPVVSFAPMSDSCRGLAIRKSKLSKKRAQKVASTHILTRESWARINQQRGAKKEAKEKVRTKTTPPLPPPLHGARARALSFINVARVNDHAAAVRCCRRPLLLPPSPSPTPTTLRRSCGCRRFRKRGVIEIGRLRTLTRIAVRACLQATTANGRLTPKSTKSFTRYFV